MKRYIGILLFLLCLLTSRAVLAQTEGQGVRDEPFDVPEISEEIEALIGASKDQKKAIGERQKEELYRLLKKDKALPFGEDAEKKSKYDPRETGNVTPVKNQRSNTCWAFSTLAAGEQSLLRKGYKTPDELDLSEAHLAYFFYHSTEDPLGLTQGDGNRNISSSNFLAVGSNTIFSTFALAGWVGAANESIAPFEDLNAGSIYPASLAYADEAHLQNAYWINFKDTDAINVIKQMILTYGAAAINLYFNYDYLNETNAAYYFPLDSSQPNNHSAAIVGWDDAYPKENFNETNRPKNDGAWIIKNSYGTDWGDSGYFYLSYEDSAVHSENTSKNRARAYIFDFEPAGSYDYNYQYDGSAGAYNATNTENPYTKVESKGAIANVYTVGQKSGVQTETLHAVSFALFDTAVSYEIQIYKNPTDGANPASGIPQLKTPVTGSVSYAGYYTIPLPVPVELKTGETFSVVITLEKESGGQIEFFVDKSYQNGNWVSFTNEVKSKESYRLTANGWEDMAEYGMTARIKAFTKAGETVFAEWISLDGLERDSNGAYSLTIWLNDTYTLKPAVFPSSASQSLSWSVSDASVLAIDESGTIIPSKAGTSIVTGTATDGSGRQVTCSVTVMQKATQIRLSASNLKLKKGEQAVLTVQLLPAGAVSEEILFQSDSKAVTVDASGALTAQKEGEAAITAFLKSDASIAASCKVTVSGADNKEKQTNPAALTAKPEEAALEPNGTPKVTASKSAKTADMTDRNAAICMLALFLGTALIQKSRGKL